MMTPTHPFKNPNQRGAAMLELALAIPVFVGLLLAMVDFGLYFTTRNVLQSAAYNGAKMACNDPAQVSTTINETLGAIVSPATITMTGPTFIGVDPIRRAKVALSCSGASLSIFTSPLGLYPIQTTGLAKCP